MLVTPHSPSRPFAVAGITGALFGFMALGAEAEAQRLPKIDAIDGDRVHTLLPPDRIRAIDKPRFAPAANAKFMKDDEPVVGVVHNGIAKAYSLWHLDQHEIVNDSFADDPVAVTW